MTRAPRPILPRGDPESEMAKDTLPHGPDTGAAPRDPPVPARTTGIPREVVPPLPAFVLWEPRRPRLWPALVLGILFLCGAGVVAAAFLLTSLSPGPSTRATPPASRVPARSAAASPAGATAAGDGGSTAPDPAPTGVPAAAPPLESGLDCAALLARGIPYGAAVDYWYAEGAPGRMDTNGDGVPCESVYPALVVSAYWGAAAVGSDALAVVAELPGGLACGDLKGRGIDYAGAVAYYLREGEPERMDTDANGVACEDTYPSGEVSAYFL